MGKVVLRLGERIPLTERQLELLHLLARPRGKDLASDWIFENVWGYDAELDPMIGTVTIRRIRQKIEEDPHNPRLLLTVRGFGYKLAAS